MGDRPLRVGVVGTGFGAAVHVPGFRRIPGVEVVALVGRDAAKTRKLADALGIAQGLDAVAELFDGRVDAVSLALPPSHNARAARLAIDAGVPVLCEKPLSLDPIEARRLADDASAVTTAIDFQFAELRAFQLLRAQAGSGELGTLRSVRIDWRVMSYANRVGLHNWKTDASQGGGVMTLLGTHLVYLLEWLLGPLQSLSTDQGVSPRLNPAEGQCQAACDWAELRFEFAAGVRGHARVENAYPGAALHRWDLDFERGQLVLQNDSADYMHGFRLELHAGTRWTVLYADDVQGTEDGRLAPFVSLASRFVDGVRHARPANPDFSAAARVAELCALRAAADVRATGVPR